MMKYSSRKSWIMLLVVLFVLCPFLAYLALRLIVEEAYRAPTSSEATAYASAPPYATCEKYISETNAVRIDARYNYDQLLMGGGFTFLATTDSGQTWQRFMYFRHDDPVDPPCENIRSLDPQFYWVWMGWTSGITHDGGKTWSVWEPTHSWPTWQCCNYGLIRKVQFSGTQSGCMILNPIGDRGATARLCSDDGGATWQ